MIYQTPALEEIDLQVLDGIAKQRESLAYMTQHQPRRWTGALRRGALARNIQGSNTIEGYDADMDTAVAAAEDEQPLDPKDETWLALSGYREAMTYILQTANDPDFEFNRQLIKSLHYMMLSHDMAAHPGRWRPGPVFVTNSQTQETVYTPPPFEEVNALLGELVEYLSAPSDNPALVRGAMAHLNLTMIHPFKDGNGRLSRALQTLVIARDGVLAPVFSSIEEWLGRNTQAYYDVLAKIGKGQWNPDQNALEWVRFCLKGHHQQAATLIRRNEEFGKLYEDVLTVISRERLQERVWPALFDAAMGLKVMNIRYRREAEVSEYVASRDLRQLSDLGLLVPKGEKRGRTYSAGQELIAMRQRNRVPFKVSDPYEIARNKAKPTGLLAALLDTDG